MYICYYKNSMYHLLQNIQKLYQNVIFSLKKATNFDKDPD